MPKSIIRLVAFLLVPCLLTDPISAASWTSAQPLHPVPVVAAITAQAIVSPSWISTRTAAVSRIVRTVISGESYRQWRKQKDVEPDSGVRKYSLKKHKSMGVRIKIVAEAMVVPLLAIHFLGSDKVLSYFSGFAFFGPIGDLPVEIIFGGLHLTVLILHALERFIHHYPTAVIAQTWLEWGSGVVSAWSYAFLSHAGLATWLKKHLPQGARPDDHLMGWMHREVHPNLKLNVTQSPANEEDIMATVIPRENNKRSEIFISQKVIGVPETRTQSFIQKLYLALLAGWLKRMNNDSALQSYLGTNPITLLHDAVAYWPKPSKPIRADLTDPATGRRIILIGSDRPHALAPFPAFDSVSDVIRNMDVPAEEKQKEVQKFLDDRALVLKGYRETVDAIRSGLRRNPRAVLGFVGPKDLISKALEDGGHRKEAFLLLAKGVGFDTAADQIADDLLLGVYGPELYLLVTDPRLTDENTIAIDDDMSRQRSHDAVDVMLKDLRELDLVDAGPKDKEAARRLKSSLSLYFENQMSDEAVSAVLGNAVHFDAPRLQSLAFSLASQWRMFQFYSGKRTASMIDHIQLANKDIVISVNKLQADSLRGALLKQSESEPPSMPPPAHSAIFDYFNDAMMMSFLGVIAAPHGHGMVLALGFAGLLGVAAGTLALVQVFSKPHSVPADGMLVGKAPPENVSVKQAAGQLSRWVYAHPRGFQMRKIIRDTLTVVRRPNDYRVNALTMTKAEASLSKLDQSLSADDFQEFVRLLINVKPVLKASFRRQPFDMDRILAHGGQTRGPQADPLLSTLTQNVTVMAIGKASTSEAALRRRKYMQAVGELNDALLELSRTIPAANILQDVTPTVIDGTPMARGQAVGARLTSLDTYIWGMRYLRIQYWLGRMEDPQVERISGDVYDQDFGMWKSEREWIETRFAPYWPLEVLHLTLRPEHFAVYDHFIDPSSTESQRRAIEDTRILGAVNIAKSTLFAGVFKSLGAFVVLGFFAVGTIVVNLYYGQGTMFQGPDALGNWFHAAEIIFMGSSVAGFIGAYQSNARAHILHQNNVESYERLTAGKPARARAPVSQEQQFVVSKLEYLMKLMEPLAQTTNAQYFQFYRSVAINTTAPSWRLMENGLTEVAGTDHALSGLWACATFILDQTKKGTEFDASVLGVLSEAITKYNKSEERMGAVGMLSTPLLFSLVLSPEGDVATRERLTANITKLRGKESGEVLAFALLHKAMTHLEYSDHADYVMVGTLLDGARDRIRDNDPARVELEIARTRALLSFINPITGKTSPLPMILLPEDILPQVRRARDADRASPAPLAGMYLAPGPISIRRANQFSHHPLDQILLDPWTPSHQLWMRAIMTLNYGGPGSDTAFDLLRPRFDIHRQVYSQALSNATYETAIRHFENSRRDVDDDAFNDAVKKINNTPDEEESMDDFILRLPILGEYPPEKYDGKLYTPGVINPRATFETLAQQLGLVYTEAEFIQTSFELISAYRTRQSEEYLGLELRLIDIGWEAGIPRAVMQQLFEGYEQLDETGDPLPLAKALLHAWHTALELRGHLHHEDLPHKATVEYADDNISSQKLRARPEPAAKVSTEQLITDFTNVSTLYMEQLSQGFVPSNESIAHLYTIGLQLGLRHDLVDAFILFLHKLPREAVNLKGNRVRVQQTVFDLIDINSKLPAYGMKRTLYPDIGDPKTVLPPGDPNNIFYRILRVLRVPDKRAAIIGVLLTPVEVLGLALMAHAGWMTQPWSNVTADEVWPWLYSFAVPMHMAIAMIGYVAMHRILKHFSSLDELKKPTGDFWLQWRYLLPFAALGFNWSHNLFNPLAVSAGVWLFLYDWPALRREIFPEKIREELEFHQILAEEIDNIDQAVHNKVEENQLSSDIGKTLREQIGERYAAQILESLPRDRWVGLTKRLGRTIQDLRGLKIPFEENNALQIALALNRGIRVLAYPQFYRGQQKQRGQAPMGYVMGGGMAFFVLATAGIAVYKFGMIPTSFHFPAMSKDPVEIVMFAMPVAVLTMVYLGMIRPWTKKREMMKEMRRYSPDDFIAYAQQLDMRGFDPNGPLQNPTAALAAYHAVFAYRAPREIKKRNGRFIGPDLRGLADSLIDEGRAAHPHKSHAAHAVDSAA